MSILPSFLSALVSSLRSTIRAVSPPFGEEPCCSKWLSPLSVRCRHHSVKSHGRVVSGFLKKVRLFLYKERRQLWNITVNSYITRNNMQVQFIRFRQKISPFSNAFFRLCFIQCNIAHSRFAKRHIQSRTHIIGRFEHNSLERLAAASGCMSSIVKHRPNKKVGVI